MYTANQLRTETAKSPSGRKGQEAIKVNLEDSSWRLPGTDNSRRITKLSAFLITPEMVPKIKYNVPIARRFVLHSQRVVQDKTSIITVLVKIVIVLCKA